jgi:hypothetical protein
MTLKILFALAASTGLFLSSAAPAQVHVHARLGRHFSIGADLGGFGHRHHHRRASGHWQTIHERVWVPGCSRTVYHPAVYGWIYDRCGHRTWGVITPARTELVQEPGRWECRERRVWVPC